jgi:hypothetical protein
MARKETGGEDVAFAVAWRNSKQSSRSSGLMHQARSRESGVFLAS